MRLLVGQERPYSVDKMCTNSSDCKRLLAGEKVVELYIEKHLEGYESGEDILEWAFRRNIWPPKITLIGRRIHERLTMGKALVGYGYHSRDGVNYLRI